MSECSCWKVESIELYSLTVMITVWILVLVEPMAEIFVSLEFLNLMSSSGAPFVFNLINHQFVLISYTLLVRVVDQLLTASSSFNKPRLRSRRRYSVGGVERVSWQLCRRNER